MKKVFKSLFLGLLSVGMVLTGCKLEEESNNMALIAAAAAGGSGHSASYEVPVVTITSGLTNDTCSAGETITLTATTSVKNVTWAWYDNALNSLGEGNYLTALKKCSMEVTVPSKAGKYTYTVIAQNAETTNDEYSGTAEIQITVSAGSVTSELQSITVTGATVRIGSNANVTVTATYKEGNSTTTKDVTSSATYQSSNESIFTVDSDGKVTGIAAGNAELTASFGGKTAKNTITVNDANVTLTSITIEPSTISGEAGTTSTIAVKANWSNGSVTDVTSGASVTSDSDCVTVSGSSVNLVSAGSATLTATYEGKTATCTITVTAPTITLTSITLTLGTTSLDLAGTKTTTLKTTAHYSNGTTKEVSDVSATYSTSGVVSYASQVVTALAEGETTITISYTEAGVTKTATTNKITVENTGSGEGSGTIGFDFN